MLLVYTYPPPHFEVVAVVVVLGIQSMGCTYAYIVVMWVLANALFGLHMCGVFYKQL